MTVPRETSTTFDLFLPFSKIAQQDDGTLLVHSLVNDQTVDDQGEIVTFEAVEKASGAFMEWGNVREMHDDHTAAGTVLSLSRDEAAGTHEAIVHVVDPVAVKKVLAKVYKGTSLGGFKTRIQLSKVDGKPVRRVTGIDWRELSLVDRPSRPSATLSLLKRSDVATDPPPLVEEILEDEPLAKAADTTAPEAGEDVYLDAAGEPLQKREIGQEARDAMPSKDFAGKDQSFPIEKPGDVAAAASSIGRAGSGNFSGDELKRRIIAIAKRKGPTFMAKLPKAWMDGEMAKASEIGDLAKSAAHDVAHATTVLNCINELIEDEAEEGDDADVAFLRGARAGILGFIGSESEEVGTPEDLASSNAEDAIMTTSINITASGPVPEAPLAQASAGGDLSASETPADELRATIAQVVEEVLAKRATDPVTEPAVAAPEPPATPEEPPVDPAIEILAKVSAFLDEQRVSPTDLAAMKAEILGAVAPLKEDLAKIARQPAPGGPARYAIDTSRLDGAGDGSPLTEAEVLHKASQVATDPHVKEALGLMAATATIAAQRGSPTP